MPNLQRSLSFSNPQPDQHLFMQQSRSLTKARVSKVIVAIKALHLILWTVRGGQYTQQCVKCPFT